MASTNFKGSLTYRKEIIIHVCFWVLVVYYTLISFDRNNPYYFSIAEPDHLSVFWSMVFLSTFYFNYLVIMPRIFRNFNWKKVVAGAVTGYVFFVTIRFLLEQVIMKLIYGQGNYYEDTNALFYLYDNLYYSTLPLIASTLFWLIIFLFRLMEFNTFISEEKREIEVKFLKAQLNPHFMFNTLNNIYSLVHLKSEKALPAIEKLGDIMRFTTYESQKDTIDIEDEIKYIKSYLELEELRHNRNFFVKQYIDTGNQKLQLPPFILSPLVENAVKHGDWNEDTPLEIYLKCTTNLLYFKVTNLIGKKNKHQVPGIGIENLKKRLHIYYPGKNRLDLKSHKNIFTAELEIQL